MNFAIFPLLAVSSYAIPATMAWLSHVAQLSSVVIVLYTGPQ